jgi:hypothetical protein
MLLSTSGLPRHRTRLTTSVRGLRSFSSLWHNILTMESIQIEVTLKVYIFTVKLPKPLRAWVTFRSGKTAVSVPNGDTDPWRATP